MTGSNDESSKEYTSTSIWDGIARLPRRIVNEQLCWYIVMTVFGYGMEAGYFCARCLGPAFILLATALILFVLYAFITQLLPIISGTSEIYYILHLVYALFLLSNVFFNYVMCILTPPGSPEPCDEPEKYFGMIMSIVDGKPVYQERFKLVVAPGAVYRYCKRCKAIRPPRAQHCG